MGRLDEAYLGYERASGIVQSLLTIDPENPGWLDKVSDLYAEIGWVFECQGNFADALNRYQEDLRISEALVSTGTQKDGWTRDLGLAHLNCDRVFLILENAHASVVSLGEAARIFGKLRDTLRTGTMVDYAGVQASRRCWRKPTLP